MKDQPIPTKQFQLSNRELQIAEDLEKANHLLETLNSIGIKCDELLTWATIDDHARRVLTEISNDIDKTWGIKPQRKTQPSDQPKPTETTIDSAIKGDNSAISLRLSSSDQPKPTGETTMSDKIRE